MPVEQQNMKNNENEEDWDMDVYDEIDIDDSVSVCEFSENMKSRQSIMKRDDDYSDCDENYPSDLNYDRFKVHNDIKDKVNTGEYNIISNKLIFLSGPARTVGNTKGKVHQKKSYKVCVLIPPDAFVSLKQMRLKEWDKYPDFFRRGLIPKFRHVVTLHLGTINRIVRSYHSFIRSASKLWTQTVLRSDRECYCNFDITFTELTSKKLKSNPLRMYAQLCYESNFEPGVYNFEAQGQSLMFTIYSHSQQYGYIRSSICPMCNHNYGDNTSNAVLLKDDNRGFKKKDGTRKIYTCNEQALSSWQKEYSDDRDFDHVKAMTIHSIFPQTLMPGDCMLVFLHGSDTFPSVTHIYAYVDHMTNVLVLMRIKMNDFVFSAHMPHFCKSDSSLSSPIKEYHISKIGLSPDNMIDIPNSEVTCFRFKTREEIMSYHNCLFCNGK